ncbi:ferredoxin:thioredoxin reductase [Candidatus Pacearchaeota archaeon]|nr:ferredoxin:thioredoxin reductase [Candidatus Pacearchaeota archaeon]
MKTSEEFHSEDEKEFVKDAEAYAKKVGLKLNPDKQAIERLLKGFFRNKKERGELYCPCRVVSGDKEKDKEIICPCVFHRGEVELEGNCRCTLFFGKKG